MLNKLSLTATVYLASDIHLGPSIPRTNQVFYQFLKQAALQADSLILVGDIFNYWIGDDIAIQHPEPWLVEAIAHLQAFSAKKPLYLVRGNRDFLMGHDFAKLIGATLLDDQILLEVDHQLIHLSHGDELCTNDKSYMLFRAWTRQAWLQRLFFQLPMSWRIYIANNARRKSKEKQAAPSYDDTKGDVVPSTVAAVFKRYPKLNGMIHGHTHKPKKHALEINGKSYWRLVLPDWELDQEHPRSGYAILTKDGVQLISDSPN
ncbi:MAG: UDP-2,3-diacylglucosamine diphosphatase [Alcaligenaceae bacterium]|nr:UDP-2,3-diacylglucosamine diphosphatase [Alcaligenaceae bacterium]